jgi:diguanylate cyclase (GGDEF)-like protein
MIKKLLAELDASVADDRLRRRLQFIWMFRLFMAVAFGMTIVNILTDKRLLGWSTFIFFILCGINAFLASRNERCLRISAVLFVIEFYALLIFFIVSGTPEGFSALWICMLPTFGILLFGRTKGTVMSAVMLGVVIFFFDTPLGVSFLQYRYTDSFRLRFPMIYVSFYLISLFMETVRVLTQQKLNKTQDEYRYLYAHDALTGLYNRYGFNELVDRAFSYCAQNGIAMLIVDIDRFKDVNDQYGHPNGDVVLKEVADRLRNCVGSRGEVCRWGGEEFAILLHTCEGADQLGRDLCSAIRDTGIALENRTIHITVSVGVCAYDGKQPAEIGDIVRQADQCLYRVKQNGRNSSEACMIGGNV